MFDSRPEEALDHLLPLVYDELRRVAHRQRLRQRPSETLCTTALVHEAYLRLSGRESLAWENKTHFFHLAARAMRDILVDYARRKQAAKRGGSQHDLSLSDLGDPGDLGELSDAQLEEIISLDNVLAELEKLDPRQARIVELRYFVGLTIQETADVLEVSPTTVKRDWRTAMAWLYRAMQA